jgi:hypothetical protein
MQKDNVANQREHLILLLANVHVRLSPKPTLKFKVILIDIFLDNQMLVSNKLIAEEKLLKYAFLTS